MYKKQDKTNYLLDGLPYSPISNIEVFEYELQEKKLMSDMEVETDSNDEGSRSGLDSFLNDVSSQIKMQFKLQKYKHLVTSNRL